MKYSLIWSPNALLDMEQLYDFYAINNTRAAARIYNGILDEVSILEEQPKLGAIEETLKHRSKSYRNLIVSKGRFKVLYFLENNDIYIAGIWNCKQNPDKMISKYI